MKRINNIYHKFLELDNFKSAYKKALKGKKFRKQVYMNKYDPNLDYMLGLIIDDIKNKIYKAGPYNIFYITRPKLRKICVAPFEDRIIHHALINVIGDRFEHYMIHDCFACRKNKGIDAAIKRAKQFCDKYKWFLKLDIIKYFDNIDHDLLYNRLCKLIKDKDILWLIHNIIYSYNQEKGVPIGNLTSQYFANVFLTSLDHYIKEELKIKGYCRYMDDFICFFNNKDDLYYALERIKEFINKNLNLDIHIPVINHIKQGVPFLGFRVHPNKIKLMSKTKHNFKLKIRSLNKKLEENEIDISEYRSSLFSVFGHIYRANSFNYLKNQCQKNGKHLNNFFNYAFFEHKCKFNIND